MSTAIPHTVNVGAAPSLGKGLSTPPVPKPVATNIPSALDGGRAAQASTPPFPVTPPAKTAEERERIMDFGTQLSLQDLVNSALETVKTASVHEEAARQIDVFSKQAEDYCSETEEKKEKEKNKKSMEEKKASLTKTSSAYCAQLRSALAEVHNNLVKTAEELGSGDGRNLPGTAKNGPGAGPGDKPAVSQTDMSPKPIHQGHGHKQPPMNPGTQDGSQVANTIDQNPVSVDGGKQKTSLPGDKTASDVIQAAQMVALKQIKEASGKVPVSAVRLMAMAKEASAVPPTVNTSILDHLAQHPEVQKFLNAGKNLMPDLSGVGTAAKKELSDAAGAFAQGARDNLHGRLKASGSAGLDSVIEGAEGLVDGGKSKIEALANALRGNKAAPAASSSAVEQALNFAKENPLPVAAGGAGLAGLGYAMSGGGKSDHPQGGMQTYASDISLIRKVAASAGGYGGNASVSGGDGNPPQTSESGQKTAPTTATGDAIAGSNESATNITRREAKKQDKDDLRAFFDEPALTSGTDPVLNQAFAHTSEAGAKIASDVANASNAHAFIRNLISNLPGLVLSLRL